jgi:hypothetical protein
MRKVGRKSGTESRREGAVVLSVEIVNGVDDSEPRSGER